TSAVSRHSGTRPSTSERASETRQINTPETPCADCADPSAMVSSDCNRTPAARVSRARSATRRALAWAPNARLRLKDRIVSPTRASIVEKPPLARPGGLIFMASSRFASNAGRSESEGLHPDVDAAFGQQVLDLTQR